MQKAIAKHIVVCAFRAGSQLEDIIHFAKTYCDDGEYQTLLKAVATAIAGIHTEIVNDILAEHQDLEQEIEESVQKYGVII
jgi:hypothetical protein